MIYNDCRDCKKYQGDCGKHFKDADGHIHYDISKEMYMDNVIGPHASCFEPSADYIESRKTEKVKEIVKQYTVKELEQALEVIKREPRRPLEQHYVSVTFETVGKCPKCGAKVVDSIGGTQNQCEQCGQPLLWE